MEQFRYALLWALCLQAEDSVCRLASYPGDDLPDESHVEGDFGPNYKAFLIHLSDLLLGRTDAGRGLHAEVVAWSRDNRANLQNAALSRIFASDVDGFLAALVDCIRYDIKRSQTQRGLDGKLSINSTILYHCAERAGMHVAVPERYVDYLVIVERPKGL